MWNTRTQLTTFIALIALVGCDSAADERAEADRALREADQKAAQVASEVDRKVAEVKKNAAEETDALRREAAEKMNDVNAVAREKGAEADAALAKAREDVRIGASRRLETLDKDVVELRTKIEKKLPKVDADKIVQSLDARSEAVRQSLRELDEATTANLASMKKALDQRVEELDRAIADAKKRV